MNTCHECGNEYKRISTHWSASNCQHPPLTDHQHEVLTGLVLGDGCVSHKDSGKHPHFQMNMITEEYLEHLSDNVFPTVGHDVYFNRTAEESAKAHRKDGFNPSASAKDYSDLYQFKLIPHPELQKYRDWYSSGSKVFPENIELTPMTLKHYFAGDGSYYDKDKRAKITLCNERGNKNKIVKMFERAGFNDFTWSTAEMPGGRAVDARVRFGVEGTENFFDYIGSPLPGFEYKWK